MDGTQSEACAESPLQGAACHYLSNDIPVLGMNLSDGSQLSQAGEDLVELKQNACESLFPSQATDAFSDLTQGLITKARMG